MITLPAKERYMQFIKEKPSAIKYAPLKHIATYLGITRYFAESYQERNVKILSYGKIFLFEGSTFAPEF